MPVAATSGVVSQGVRLHRRELGFKQYGLRPVTRALHGHAFDAFTASRAFPPCCCSIAVSRSGKAGGPVPSPEAMFAAGEDRQPLVDVAIDGVELPAGVPVAEVRAPAPQHGIEVGDHNGHRPRRLRTRGRRADFVGDRTTK
jgi:hypothetical protein